MTRTFRHIALPAVAPLLFFSIAAIPVEAIGCRNRGLLAVAVTQASAAGSLASVVAAQKGRTRRDPDSAWWIVTAIILAVPVVGLIILA
jgi:hypothetical protein